jgi:preprotein translocase subunit SecD
MNRYPLWKYVIIGVALLAGLLFALPNLFPSVPAVQIASAKATVKIEPTIVTQVKDILTKAGIQEQGIFYQEGASPSVRVRVASDDVQLKAKDALVSALNPDPNDESYVVALNRVSSSPAWLTALGARPMSLGLDLQGGIHFLMQVDMSAAINKRLDSLTTDFRSTLRDKTIRSNGVERNGQEVDIAFNDAETAGAAMKVLADGEADLDFKVRQEASGYVLAATLKPSAATQLQSNAIQQNITTLRNRVNQLGTSEPVIQPQGADRIVVELPGVQDATRAKEIIGRTATLEARLVDSSPEAMTALATSSVPFGDDRFTERGGIPLLVKKQVVFSGDDLTDAQASFDPQTQQPIVMLTLGAKGARTVREVSRANIHKRMALILFEKNKGEIITAPEIQSELGQRFQISGTMTPSEATDEALLLRAGALAAPMDIIEERSIGPSLGKDNIERGFLSVVYGFLAITVFMVIYYMLFGLVSVVSLGSNLLFLIAILSALQATVTLPGIAAIALALGMAIDSNVLINERIREELRNGSTPQAAIAAGYERAFGTILDSNITTLIAGLALLAFGSGPIRGFAIVHCIGIVTSIFSSVFVSRGIVNLIYGRRRKLSSLAIGQVWKPA